MQHSTRTETRGSLLLSLFVLALVTTFFVLPTQLQWEVNSQGRGIIQKTTSHEEGIENYDIRNQKGEEIDNLFQKMRNTVGKDAAAIADIRQKFVTGEESLRTRVPSLKIEYNTDINIPEVITPDVYRHEIERLSGPTTVKRSEALRNFAKQNNQLIGMEIDQLDQLKVIADYVNPRGNMAFAHLEQQINGVPVFRGEIKAGFTTSGEIIRVINNLAPGLDYNSLSTDFRDPADAVRAAARYINSDASKLDMSRDDSASTENRVVFGRGDSATTAERMYFPLEPGVAVPAWRVLIWQPVNAYYIIVDAETGAMLWRKNTTEDQTTAATYNVYNNANAYMKAADSPAPLSPGPVDPTTGQQGAIISRSNITLIGNEAPNTFNNNGWITDGANVTDGNAVEAGLDRVAPDGVDAPMPGDTACPGAGCRVFSSPTWNPPPGSPTPGDDPLTAQAQRGAVIQMFYVMNRYHDVMYQLGWTEQAFNFQTDNFGRGGTGNDRLRAEGQDSSGTNNANMSTQADGTRPRMQMFLWTGPTPDYDGTVDSEVLIHEVTHGLSNRLHGNASGLSTNMARGMGEGWSDWYAYTLLAEPTDPIDGIYTTGGYATLLVASGFTGNYYYGIRRFPRAPITFLGPNGKPHNPFTFRYINSDCNTLIGTTTSNPPPNSAFPRGPIGVTTCDQVHNIGEIWSSMLWEVRNRMVTRLGFNAGTTRALQVVTDGMKLAPIGPTILQERDAIIAAASALPAAPEAAADVLDVREGFRVRGAGFSAAISSAGTGANNTVVTEAFDVPNAIFTNPISVSDSSGDNDGFPEPGESVLVSIPVTNNSGGGTINNVNISVTGGGTVNYGNIANGATVTQQVPYTVPGGAACGSLHQITITGTSALGAMNPQNFSFRLGAPVGGAPVAFTNSTLINLPNGQPTTTSGPASPYPSTINATGLTGQKNIRLTLNGFRHEWYNDMDFLLVGPGGQKFIFMSDNGNNATEALPPITFSITDTAAALLPGTNAGVIADGGEYRPSNVATPDPFVAPAPAAPYESAAPVGTATFASVFGTDGTAMNGTWSLYAVDDAGSDPGTINGGWTLTFEANDYACSVTPQTGNGRADFDGDGRTDVSVYRGSQGTWYLNQSTAGFGAIGWGIATDVPVPADYDNDGKTDTAIFRAAADPAFPDFYVLNSNGFTVSGVSWGIPGDVPTVSDYDGDGKADFAIYRQSDGTWYILLSSNGGNAIVNNPGTTPVPADYDGDGNSDGVIFTNGNWVGTASGGGSINISFGSAGDIPVPGNYDGDNKVDQAVFRPSTGTWYILRSSNAQVDIITFGTTGDVPAPGDYDGDGKDDLAIFRNGTWWINASTAGVSVQNFGLATDLPIVSAARP